MPTRKLKLYFKDDSNHSKSITIDYIRDEYNEDELKTAMDQMIASKVIQTKYGTIHSKEKAEIETVSKRSFQVKEA